MADSQNTLHDFLHHLVANPVVPSALAAETFISMVNGGHWPEMALATGVATVVWSVSDRTIK